MPLVLPKAGFSGWQRPISIADLLDKGFAHCLQSSVAGPPPHAVTG